MFPTEVENGLSSAVAGGFGGVAVEAVGVGLENSWPLKVETPVGGDTTDSCETTPVSGSIAIRVLTWWACHVYSVAKIPVCGSNVCR